MKKASIGILFFLCISTFLWAAPTTVTLNFKTHFGAVGDGVVDDSKAWSDAIDSLSGKNNSNKKTNYRLVIPYGVYLIGAQKKGPNGGMIPKYTQLLQYASNIEIIGESNPSKRDKPVFVYASGKGPRNVKLDKKIPVRPEVKISRPPAQGNYPGLYYGYFDKDLNPASSANGNFKSYCSEFITINATCDNITIRNLEINGNVNNAKLGKITNHDLNFIGIYLEKPKFVLISKVDVHHFGKDGIYVKCPYELGSTKQGTEFKKSIISILRLNPQSPAYSVILDNSKFEYNGRQGMSVTAGSGLLVNRSNFTNTGKGGYSIAPGANVDIAPNSSDSVKNVLFINCKLSKNKWTTGSLNLEGGGDKIKNFKMKGCQIETDTWLAIQANYTKSRDFEFEDCTIIGAIEFVSGATGVLKLGNKNTVFRKCKIKDNKFTGVGWPENNTRELIVVTDKVVFEQCDLYMWGAKRKVIKSVENDKTPGATSTGPNYTAVNFHACNFFEVLTV